MKTLKPATLASIAIGSVLGGITGGLTSLATAGLRNEAMPEAGEFARLILQSGYAAGLLACIGAMMGAWHLRNWRGLPFVFLMGGGFVVIIVGIQLLFDGDLVISVARATGYYCGSVGVFLAGRRILRIIGADKDTDGQDDALGDS